MTARREYALALLGLAGGGLGVVAAYQMTWASAQIPLLAGAAGTGRSVTLSGAALAPVGLAGGWLAVAAVAGVVATRGVGRRIVAAIAVLGGLTGVGSAVAFGVRGGRAVAAVEPSATAITTTLAWVVAAVAALVVVGAAGWTLGRGGRWPSLGARYERADADLRRIGAARNLSDWDAQDLGWDPTADDRLVE